MLMSTTRQMTVTKNYENGKQCRQAEISEKLESDSEIESDGSSHF